MIEKHFTQLLKIIYNWVLSLSKIIILYNYIVFCFKVQKLRLETLRCLLKNYQIYFKNSLIIHEENTKEMNVNRIKICPDLHKLQL